MIFSSKQNVYIIAMYLLNKLILYTAYLKAAGSQDIDIDAEYKQSLKGKCFMKDYPVFASNSGLF